MKTKIKYKRILLKLSGESFGNENGRGVETKQFVTLAKEVQKIVKLGVELAIVVGGGNILRGAKLSGTGKSRIQADQVGMIATAVNALLLQDVLEGFNINVHVISAVEIKNITEPFVLRNCLKYLKEKNVVIFAGGTGNPYFTTDTAAALRALETKCDIVLKATKVDGVYDKDPQKYSDAKKFDTISFKDAITDKEIEIMDNSALSLCMDNKIPILVFNLTQEGNISKAASGEKIGTLIS